MLASAADRDWPTCSIFAADRASTCQASVNASDGRPPPSIAFLCVGGRRRRFGCEALYLTIWQNGCRFRKRARTVAPNHVREDDSVTKHLPSATNTARGAGREFLGAHVATALSKEREAGDETARLARQGSPGVRLRRSPFQKKRGSAPTALGCEKRIHPIRGQTNHLECFA